MPCHVPAEEKEILADFLAQVIKEKCSNDFHSLSDRNLSNEIQPLTFQLCRRCRNMSAEKMGLIRVEDGYPECAKILLEWYAEHLILDISNTNSSEFEKDFAKNELDRIGYEFIDWKDKRNRAVVAYGFKVAKKVK